MAEQLAEYRRQTELRGTPEQKVRHWMGKQIFYFSHGSDVNHAWAASRTVDELDAIVESFMMAKNDMIHGMKKMRLLISFIFRSRI